MSNAGMETEQVKLATPKTEEVRIILDPGIQTLLGTHFSRVRTCALSIKIIQIVTFNEKSVLSFPNYSQLS